MTGRFAMHHGIVDWIPPAQAYGLPLNETTLADKFQQAGYANHATGKWHLGFYKWAMTPTFRGFESFVGFYSGGEGYFSHESSGGYDFRRDATPRCGEGCSEVAWQDGQRGLNCTNVADCPQTYSTTVFTAEAVRVVRAHDFAAKPLFLYLAYQGVHAPAQVPQHYVDAYAKTIADPKRRTFAGMLSAVDEGIGNVTKALEAKGQMNNTVHVKNKNDGCSLLLVVLTCGALQHISFRFVFTADNGGPTTTGDGVGARNWPLRGGKPVNVSRSIFTHWSTSRQGSSFPLRALPFSDRHSIWDGGVRATAFIAGAGIAPSTSGSNLFRGLMHGADWLPTLSSVAGYDLRGTLPLDGVDQWAFLAAQPLGEAAAAARAATGRAGPFPSARASLVVGNSTNDCSWAPTDPRYHGAANRADLPNGAPEVQAVQAAVRGAGAGKKKKHALQCGFATRKNEGAHKWKLIYAYGGGPDTWCNSSAAGPVCAPHGPTSSGEHRHGKGPPEPVSTCPGGWCLYDVAADPFEERECSAANAAVAAALRADMRTVLEGYHQYEVDTSCPKHVFPNDPHVGPVWGPWCGVE